MDGRLVGLSKKMSWLLRHGAISAGVAMEDDGTVSVEEMLRHASFRGYTVADVRKVVEHNDKKRFVLIMAGAQLRVRAQQGHGQLVAAHVKQENLLEAMREPPQVCIHGTYLKHWDLIRQDGLKRMSRQHIHLTDLQPRSGQEKVSGFRENCELLIFVDAAKAMQDGCKFYRSGNGVILTEGFDGVIPARYFQRVTRKDGTEFAMA
ncbi:hypothetical protein GUITHDRAFT_145506 [Guillardia theta CCMP2712]|uniref:2'-phosphotransferase n=1 Tax=Guillardia theta (strain CCMP2712) TaxID=905079 RepID=L1ILL3_GUITC|nr:hypothetical protein GUITHDRAFT_145506 [Guillardia theta CCMP2712]EKX36764.1 hypothetical protein GUITHDRAFT_145506 [Guillardia theta CCMP2712]|eukprot:XP_005823744.1 hypothetical protein GUITHDRAFT_145506 [Guillardia theta CCMP2712]